MVSDCGGDDNWQSYDGGGEEGRCLAFKCGGKGVKGIGMVSYLIVVIKNTAEQLKLTIFRLCRDTDTKSNGIKA